MIIITELLEGACGKMIQADREGEEEAMHGVGGLETLRHSKHEVLEPSYRWPRPTLGRKKLKEQGLNCSDGPVVQVGLDVPVGCCEVGDAVGALDCVLGRFFGRLEKMLLAARLRKKEVQQLRMGQRPALLRGLRPSDAL